MYYFASDIHLGAGGEAFAQQTERLFVRWLDDAAQDAEAIFLVGDVFDFWFEYRGVVPKGFVRTLGKLAELTAVSGWYSLRETTTCGSAITSPASAASRSIPRRSNFA